MATLHIQLKTQLQSQLKTQTQTLIACRECGRWHKPYARGLCCICYKRERDASNETDLREHKERGYPVFRTPDARARFIRFVETLLAAPGSALERSVVYRRLYLNTSMLDYLMSQCETARILLWEGEGEIGLLEPGEARQRLDRLIAQTAEAQAS